MVICLNGITQRTIEMNLNGVIVKLLENRIPTTSQKLEHLYMKHVLGM